jgi:hypothetical protein
LTRLRHCPAEFFVNDLLHALKTCRGRELLLDDLAGFFQGDNL